MDAWLSAYTILRSDMVFLERYMVLHLESLTDEPVRAVAALRAFLGWPTLIYEDLTARGASKIISDRSTKGVSGKIGLRLSSMSKDV
jgi:hypothetical protein